MTTFVSFAPVPTQVFQFQATLDGAQYNVQITWNVDGQRWFLNVYDNTGTLIVTRAVVGSPPDYDIDLIWGYFTTSTLVLRQATQMFEVGP